MDCMARLKELFGFPTGAQEDLFVPRPLFRGRFIPEREDSAQLIVIFDIFCMSSTATRFGGLQRLTSPFC